MQIVLYQNIKPLNHITRTFTLPVALVGNLRDGCDIIDPDIEVEYNSAFFSYNYAYIADFGDRYYYFREAPTIEGKKMILHLTADSLYNWRTIIMKSQCIAERSSSLYDVFLADSAVTDSTGYRYYSRSLPYEFRPDYGSYVLFVAGGQ